LPQKSDESPTAETPRNARRPYGFVSEGSPGIVSTVAPPGGGEITVL
jgi:hypothetical protein